MDSRLTIMIGVATCFVALLVYVRWRIKINAGFVFVGELIWKAISSPKTCKVLETFFNEAAVLWFVFPLLDSLYDPSKKGNPNLLPAFSVSGLFLIFAIVLSHASKED